MNIDILKSKNWERHLRIDIYQVIKDNYTVRTTGVFNDKLLTVSIILSITVHFLMFYLPRVMIVEDEINPLDYKLVQLVDMEPLLPMMLKSENADGELKPVEQTPKEVKELPREVAKPVTELQNYSNYLPFFQVARLPEFIQKVKPEYPLTARVRDIESSVIAEGYIDAEGKMRKVVIVKSGSTEFDAAVIAALYKSKFKPAISKEGKPVAVKVRIPFKFELE